MMINLLKLDLSSSINAINTSKEYYMHVSITHPDDLTCFGLRIFFIKTAWLPAIYVKYLEKYI